MNNVMLLDGTVFVNAIFEKLMSLRCVMLATVWSAGEVDFNCHTCAVPRFGKLVRLIATAALVVACLLSTITVSAPSPARTAAKVDTRSGFGPVAETLVSPK